MLEWIESSFTQRKAHVEVLLESLEHRDAVIRFTNARRLLYVLQGVYMTQLFSGLIHKRKARHIR